MSVNNRRPARRVGKHKDYIYQMVVMALFVALAYATMFVFRFNVAFLTFDLKDVFLTIGGLLFGPIAAVAMSFITAFLEFITVADTGPYGFIMNFTSSAAFTGICALVYKYRKKLSGAFIGLVAAVISMTAVMMVLNLVVTPLYMENTTSADVAKMIPTLLLPFNLTKAVFNASFILLLYKPASRALKAAGVKPSLEGRTSDQGSSPEVSQSKMTGRRNTIQALVIGGVLFLAAVAVFVFVLHGDFEWVHNPFADFIKF